MILSQSCNAILQDILVSPLSHIGAAPDLYGMTGVCNVSVLICLLLLFSDVYHWSLADLITG